MFVLHRSRRGVRVLGFKGLGFRVEGLDPCPDVDLLNLDPCPDVGLLLVLEDPMVERPRSSFPSPLRCPQRLLWLKRFL